MKIHYLLSDAARLQWLERVVKAATLEPGFGAGLLPNNLLNRTTSLQASFLAAKKAKTDILSDRAALVVAGDAAYADLQKTYRSVRSGIVNRARLLQQSKGIYKIYGLTLNGSPPEMSGRHAWLQHAEEMVAGETVAVERGYTPLEFPPMTMLATAVDTAKTSFLAIDGANLEHQEAVAALNRQRDLVGVLFRDIFAYLQYILGSMKVSARREVLRRYGYTFKGNATPNEETDPPTTEDPTVPTGSEDPVEEPNPDDSDPIPDPTGSEQPQTEPAETPVP